jgi:hypothetical protein
MGSRGPASAFSHKFANRCKISTIEERLCATPVITAALWAASISCVTPAAAADAISNASLRVEVAEADGALVVTDLRTKREWRQAVVE